MAEMRCKENGCNGTIDPNQGGWDIMVGCRNTARAIVCNKCGRLHWPDGEAVFNRSGRPSFIVDGRLGIRNDDGTLRFL